MKLTLHILTWSLLIFQLLLLTEIFFPMGSLILFLVLLHLTLIWILLVVLKHDGPPVESFDDTVRELKKRNH